MSGAITTTYEEFLENEGTVTDFTDNGKCSECGGCCTNYMPISPAEVLRIKKYIKRHNIKEISKINVLLAVPTIDLTCPFRDDTKKICVIYEVRPTVCKLFICNLSKMELLESSRKFKELCPDNEPRQMRQMFYGEGD